MTKSRDEKIKEYKLKKALIDAIKIAEKRNEDNSREYWVNYLSLSWKKVIENLRTIKMEFESLSFIKNMKDSGKYNDFHKK